VAERLLEFPNLQFLVSSFYHEQLFSFREVDTDTAVAPLYQVWQEDMEDVAQELCAHSINLNVKLCKPKRINQLKESGFEVLVYTVNSLRVATKLKNLGVNAVFSDFPDRLINKGL
jgi:glycerophosphoryl diester phosphodiesterase